MTEWELIHAIIGALASGIFLFLTFGSAERGVDADVSDLSDMDCGETGGTSHGVGAVLSDYLSVRNFVAFFIGYGWVTLAALLSGKPQVTASVLGTLAGLVFVGTSLYMIKTFLKFQEDGSLKMETLIGQSASVYITIGASSSSAGKVLADTRTGRMELPARTKDARKLTPGKWVKIVGVENGMLWVCEEQEAAGPVGN